jgi:hypothetical protein
MAMMPISFTVTSAQFRGQPVTPIFTLWGVYSRSVVSSSFTPRAVESPTP